MLTPEIIADWRHIAAGPTHGVNINSRLLAALLDAADERDRLASALARAQGPFACCSHCEEDAIHDVETNAHELPCTRCQSSIGEVERLRAERDRLAAQVERVRALTYESDDGTRYEHGGHSPSAGYAECPGCWSDGILAALDARTSPPRR